MMGLWMKLIEMAWEGSVILLGVMLIRFAMKRAPKKYMCVLWTIALLRLCVPYLPQGPIPAFWRSPEIVSELNPVSVGRENFGENGAGQYVNVGTANGSDVNGLSANGSDVSFAQSWYQQSELMNQGMTGEITSALDDEEYVPFMGENDELVTNFEATEGDLTREKLSNELGKNAEATAEMETSQGKISLVTLGIGDKNVFIKLFGLVWLLGAIVALARTGLQYFRIRNQLQESVPVERFRSYPVKEHPLPGLPAVLGVFHPCIYVPTNFEGWEEKQKELILLHEATHIRRGDQLLKLFSIFVLCVYWWNPIVWIGVKLLHNDIEMACDEGVLAGKAEDSREAYAKVLLFHAVRNKQIALPIAFGENHTEGRIKNILHYKKTSIAVSAALIALVGILVICIGTKPREVAAQKAEEANLSAENGTMDGEKVRDDGGIDSSSDGRGDGSGNDSHDEESPLVNNGDESVSQNAENVGEDTENQDPEAWWINCERYWTKRLVEEGKVKNPATDLFFFRNYVDQVKDDYGRYTRVSLQAVAVDEAGSVSLYRSMAILPKPVFMEHEATDIPPIIENTIYEELDVIDRKDRMLSLEDLYFSLYVAEDQSNEEELGNANREQLIVIIANRMKSKAPENYQRLLQPASAAELLLHLEGNADEFIYDQYNSGYLRYTLSDGEMMMITMRQVDEIWYPAQVLNTFWEWDARRKSAEMTMVSNYKAENEYLQNVTASNLRKVKNSAESGVVKSEWYDHLENDFVMLSKPQNEEAKKVDAALYGMYGGNSMALRVGEKVVPIRIHWPSPQMILPVLFCGDYDGDGETEYVIRTHFKTGTGVSGDDIHVVELHGDTYKMYTLSERIRMAQLDRIPYSYDEKQRVITLKQSDGTDLTLAIGRFLDAYGEQGESAKFNALAFGSIESLFLQDGQWYYWTEGGIWLDKMHPLFDCSVEMVCPVFYSESEGFSFGEMKYTINEYEEVQNEPEAAGQED